FATNYELALMFIGIIFAGVAGSAVPATTIPFGKIVDYFTLYQQRSITYDEFSTKINFLSLVMVFFSICIFVSTYIYMATWIYTSERITRQIRERYLRAILRQNIAYFDKLSPGEVTTRITSDTHLIQQGIGEKAIIVMQ
ncbi:9710_t:CDS:2, partial [Cetraspora pellucida]